MLRKYFFFLSVLASFCLASAVTAEIKLHPLFTDHMVIPRDNPNCPIWGTAEPSEKITISIRLGNKNGAVIGVYKTQANNDGKWIVTLGSYAAGTKLYINLEGENLIELKNVVAGDVWLCSGQSNMEWRLRQLTKDDQGKTVAAMAENPNIRLYVVPNRAFPQPQSVYPQSDSEGRWLECKPETVINFSAVGYFFGREIEKSQNVPIGLIASDWGGTPAEAWTSRDTLYAIPDLRHYVDKLDNLTKDYDLMQAEQKYKAAFAKWKEEAAQAKKDGKQPPRPPQKPSPTGVNQNTPTALYNGMIAPLISYPIRGVIWYQGESNAGRAAEYYTLFPTLIRDWRKRWGYDFPFLAVQLAPFRGGPSGVDYAELRDAQFQTTRVLPQVGVAVITDVGDETDIHPQQKEPVGIRLALIARALAYGESVVYSGPTYRSLTIVGNKCIVAFDHVADGLEAKGDKLHGFTMCGEDGIFHPAQAKIQDNTVVLSCEKVAKPFAVRYGWVNFAKPALNLFNKSGLPAVPFRTDNFPLTTAKK
jgi:sialate O-acetylesterase